MPPSPPARGPDPAVAASVRHASGEPEWPRSVASLSVPKPEVLGNGGPTRRRLSRTVARASASAAVLARSFKHRHTGVRFSLGGARHSSTSAPRLSRRCLCTAAAADGGHVTNPPVVTSCLVKASGESSPIRPPRYDSATARNRHLLFARGPTIRQQLLLSQVDLNSNVVEELVQEQMINVQVGEAIQAVAHLVQDRMQEPAYHNETGQAVAHLVWERMQETTNHEDMGLEEELINFENCMSSFSQQLWHAQSFKNQVTVVKSQVPASVDRATLLAKEAQEFLDESKFCSSKSSMQAKSATSTCGGKFEPGYQMNSKLPRQQVCSLTVQDLGLELTRKVLDQVYKENALAAEPCCLSLNAISGTGEENIRLNALVKNKRMLVLVDSGSSNNFVSAFFLAKLGIKPVQTTPVIVKVANGNALISKCYVPQMEWCIQGYTFRTDMRVIELGSFDAILGYEWLKPHSPMNCHWADKTMEFEFDGKRVKLQGVMKQPLHHQLIENSVEQQGTEVWAFTVVEQHEPPPALNASSTMLLDSASTNTDASHHPIQYLNPQDKGAHAGLDGARNAVARPDNLSENSESVFCAGSESNYHDLVAVIDNVLESDILAVRNAYDAFLLRYPLCHHIWNKYAELEGRADSNREHDIYKRAVASAPYSVDIWVRYCQYLRSSCKDPDLIRRHFLEGLAFVGTNYNSNILWDEFIKFEQFHKEWNKLADIYATILKHPIQQLDFYFKSFQDLIHMHRSDINTDLELLCSRVNDSVQNASELDKKIKCFEQAMTVRCFSINALSNPEIENWHNYLDFMEKHYDVDKVSKLYERCLMVCANYSEFWIRCVLYFSFEGKIELANDVLSRATNIFFKKDKTMHMFSSWFKEFNGDVSGAREGYHFLYSKLCPGMLQAIVKLANIECRQRGKEHGCSVYQNAIAEEKRKGQSNILPSLIISYARFLFFVCQDTLKSKETLREVPLECLTKQNLEDIIDLVTKIPGAKNIELVDQAVQKFVEKESTQMSEICDKEDISTIFIQFLLWFGSLQPQLLKKAESRHRRLVSSKIIYPCLKKRKAVDLCDNLSKFRRTDEQAAVVSLVPYYDSD